jgi:hypothetical protein
MCHALLRVKYLGEKIVQIVEVESELDLQKRVSELCEKDQIVSIQIFPRERDMVLTKRWETLIYEPPAQPTAAT